MKKILSIIFALLILLSGMHLSLATHFCGGEIAAVKWSVSGEIASCGMENQNQSCPIQNAVSSKSCCQDEVAIYSVDNNYNPSTFELKKVASHIIQVFYIPVNLLFNFSSASSSLLAYISPHNKLQISLVSLPDICVFRI